MEPAQALPPLIVPNHRSASAIARKPEPGKSIEAPPPPHGGRGNWLKDQHAVGVRLFDFDEILRKTLVVGAPVALYRKAVLDQVGGYDPAIRVQDFQMTLKVAALGQPIAILPVTVTRYRSHAGNLSAISAAP